MKQIKLHQMILAAISGAVLFTVPVGAETALDPAPEIKPAQANGQKVLFDNNYKKITHINTLVGIRVIGEQIKMIGSFKYINKIMKL